MKQKKINQKHIEKLHKFLNALFEPHDTIAFTRLSDQERRAPFEDILINRDNLKKKLTLEYIDQQKESGLFFCPNPIKQQTKRLDKNVKFFNALVLDIDEGGFNISKEIPKPHFIFRRDDKHHHIYWLIERKKPSTEKFLGTLQHLIAILKADKVCKNPSRLFRLPYTYQNKINEGGYYAEV